MKQKNLFWAYPLLFTFVMLVGFSSREAKTKRLWSSDLNLVASTPGNDEIKNLLGILPQVKVDFIRWNLFLKTSESGKQNFALTITYGESQPNTLGFKNGGATKSLSGEYIITNDKESINGEVYHLKTSTLPSEILLVKLNDNIFHLLTAQKQLMIGNGGWSYTLNRKNPLKNTSQDMPNLKTWSGKTSDTAQQIIFDGRTPCSDFANENNLAVAPDCFKLKWKLVLNRDANSLKPTTYTLRRVINGGVKELTGQWAVTNGIPSNPGAVIYQLDLDKAEHSISFVMIDENVGFLLHKNGQLFIGNADFSYTLNKRPGEKK